MRAERQLSVVFLTAAVGPGTRAAPFGAARVASALKADPALSGRIRVSLVEGLSDETPEAIADRAMTLRPDVVGLSLYSWNSGLLEAAGSLLKARLPGLTLVAGGPNASADPDRLAAGVIIDIVVSGEGEEAMARIVRDIADGRQSPGNPSPGRVVKAPLLDPARLASPWLDGTLDPGAWGGAALELTRGCPYRCAFCFESKGEARLRRFPLEVAAKELASFEKAGQTGPGVEEVFVLDPTFNADSRRMAEAVRVFRERGPSLRYFLELRAELLTAEQARLLSTIDCSVQIGLQSSDPSVLGLVNRKFDPEPFSKKLRLLDEEGIVYGLDLIYGLPGDSLPGFKRSLDYALGLGPNHLDVFRLAVLPGTALYDGADGRGLERDDRAPYLVRSTPTFKAAELDAAERLAKAVEILYNRGRAVMWFRSVAVLAKARPSTLVARFADYLDAAAPRGAAPGDDVPGDDVLGDDVLGDDASHRSIEEAQLGFLRALFAEKPPKVAGAADAALELVRVSGAWTRAFAEGERTELDLGWSPEDVLDYAMADIEEFASEARKAPGRWVCEPGPEGPRFKKVGAPRRGPGRA
ncbi:MAG: cobalamin-dependent protein [Spirochaetes bacterium]|nr:cobalamin-dependent protein [Spirochaetota bacterium]